MHCQIECECGAETTVSAGQAGSVVICRCGKQIQVPLFSALKELAANQAFANKEEVKAVRTSRKPLPLKKKLAFTIFMFAIALVPIYFTSEVVYRLQHDIPISGGVVYQDDMRLDPDLAKDVPQLGTFLNRFQRSESPILFYEPRPGYEDELYKINSAGFRDREFSESKAAGIFRIVVLGDSIIWGHGIPQDKTFAKQLETQLNARNQGRFEVLNFGVSGYSTAQEVELYQRKAKRYEPDLVIVGYCLNDYFDSSLESIAFRQMHYGLFSKSYLYQHVRRGAASWSYDKLGVQLTDEEANKELRRQFKKLAELTQPKRNLLIIFPVLDDFANYGYRNEHRRATDVGVGLNYEVLDLLDAFGSHQVQELTLNNKDRTHPNVLGTKVAAETTAGVLLERGLIPATSSAVAQ